MAAKSWEAEQEFLQSKYGLVIHKPKKEPEQRCDEIATLKQAVRDLYLENWKLKEELATRIDLKAKAKIEKKEYLGAFRFLCMRCGRRSHIAGVCKCGNERTDIQAQ